MEGIATNKDNRMEVVGRVLHDPHYDHHDGEDQFMMTVLTVRPLGVEDDELPVTMPREGVNFFVSLKIKIP